MLWYGMASVALRALLLGFGEKPWKLKWIGTISRQRRRLVRCIQSLQHMQRLVDAYAVAGHRREMNRKASKLKRERERFLSTTGHGIPKRGSIKSGTKWQRRRHYNYDIWQHVTHAKEISENELELDNITSSHPQSPNTQTYMYGDTTTRKTVHTACSKISPLYFLPSALPSEVLCAVQISCEAIRDIHIHMYLSSSCVFPEQQIGPNSVGFFSIRIKILNFINLALP